MFPGNFVTRKLLSENKDNREQPLRGVLQNWLFLTLQQISKNIHAGPHSQ